MATTSTKKRLVTPLANLSQELQDEFKAQYPTGYGDVMMRVDKPNGDFFYAVPFETEEINYLVKIDVKIDDVQPDDKDFFDGDEDVKEGDELPDADVDSYDMGDDE